MEDVDVDLWLPPEYVERQRALRRAGLLTFVCWSELYNDSTDSTKLAALAASIPSESLLVAIGAISTLLANGSWKLATLKEQQRAAARELCAGEVAAAVDRMLTDGRHDVFVHEPQLLIAAKLAILHGQPGPASTVSPDTLGELLLRTNDALAADEYRVGPDPSDWAISLAVRRLGLLRNEQWRYLAPRYHDLLVTRAARDRDGADFDRVFRNETGLGIEEYLAFAFLHFLPFATAKTGQDLVGARYLTAVAETEGYFRDLDLLERCRRLYADNQAGYQAEFATLGSSARSPTTSYLPFKQHPLVRLSGGSAIPVSLPLLQEKAAVGAYWNLHEGFHRDDPRHGVRKLTAAMGRLFQEYLSELLARLCAGAHTSLRFHDEAAIKSASGKQGKKASPPFDAAIVGTDSLVLIEMATTSLTAAVLDSGDPGDFRAQVISKFVPKVEQLNGAFKGLTDGVWALDDLDRRRITYVYPVLGLLHPFPQADAALAPLVQASATADRYAFGTPPLATTFVHSLQIITAEEFEMLEPFLSATPITLPDLLRQKTSDARTTAMSMKNYLLNEIGWDEQRNEHLRVHYEQLVRRITQVLKVHLILASEETPPLDEAQRQ